MNIGIVDYQAGNITSLYNAVGYCGFQAKVLRKAEECQACDMLFFPGVGEAKAVMTVLRDTHFAEALQGFAEKERPMMGICIGAQVFLDSSREGEVKCLNLVQGTSKRFPSLPALKVPHMGWNELMLSHPSFLFEGIEDRSAVYFVHSYYPDIDDTVDLLSRTDYGISFPSAYAMRHIVATQFHPEKSGEVGLRIISNFLHWRP